jgi:hypothetical protein
MPLPLPQTRNAEFADRCRRLGRQLKEASDEEALLANMADRPPPPEGAGEKLAMWKARMKIALAHARLATRKPYLADVEVATGLHRVAIPKKDLTPAQLYRLGFKESLVAIPERGQISAVTYRQPKTNLHLHEHKKHWFAHKDRHTPLSMRQYDDSGMSEEQLKEIGKKHVLEEGLPGLGDYLKNTVTGAPTFEDRLLDPKKLKLGDTVVT